jgi:hypothetical protein
MGIRITERSSGILVTVVNVDDTTETYSFSRELLPAHFADVANTLDMVLQKVNAPVPEYGTLPKRKPELAPVPKKRAAG